MSDPRLALLLLAAALLAGPPPHGVVAGRARSLVAATRGSPGSSVPATAGSAAPGAAPSAARRWALAGAAGLATGIVVGGWTGALTAVGLAIGGERLLRRARHDEQDRRRALVRDLPGACDLLAVCLGAGVPVGAALPAVASTVSGPVGAHLSAVSAAYALGADPRRAWSAAPPELEALGRVLVRAGESGSRAVPALAALAADERAAARSATEAAVRRAGVWVLAPLGLCFLPAFVCLGVVPLVIGIAGHVFG
ncbi:type II secretion system F family protein [Geodermatophilus sp. YIM 151500]|uniref:type II secretion system F family protein n=1 Tax=Geodermatophilus sp. YIM 151500 TaxID=2984531 RepID=UPI0021E43471|nr:type II secretion system F family protein [Geodermatophilus sp. YIM 151500]MCV2491756.1 type II secretion system F family protein [Geodermatophilus sp. YIM 151500]